MEMTTESSFAASSNAERVPFTLPPVLTNRHLSPGVWRLRQASRRKAGMWQVRDGRNDAVADVYDKADAQLMVSSKTLLETFCELTKILHRLALEGCLTRGDAGQIREAIEMVRRAQLTAVETTGPGCSFAADAKDIELDPAFRTWCAQQYHLATAQGLVPLSRSELRVKYLLGER